MADIGTIVDNSRTIQLQSGASVVVPKVALATSWAVLQIINARAGVYYTVTCGDQSVKVVIDANGNAKMSLTPFMAQQLLLAQEIPLPTDGSSSKADNLWRGVLALTIATDGSSESVDVPFIYGGANPNRQVQERYIDYIAEGNLGTWVTLDLAEWFNADGTLDSTHKDDWLASNFNLNRYLDPAPTGDTIEQINVAMYNRGRIVFAPLVLHLHYDCRDEKTMLVKWLDAQGGINVRRFTFSGESEGGVTDSSYTRHHWTREKILVGDNYWAGLDKWAQRTATKQITLGDDNIEQDQFSWVASLVQSSCVEVWAETSKGEYIWQRCNVADSSVERDPRKSFFSVTLTLELAPIYNPQQF